MEIYIGKRRSECPPHIFGVAEGSYQGMQNQGKNQSILITGESGAGKTENTKKVISYFASIGAAGKKKEGEPGLEDKIVQTNPVLEAWGNAKTVRNDNSSRFGKFIRIWFNAGGKLSGADMVIYLLEKSRLTFQAELERCYHSFYNIMSDQVPDIKEKCHLSNDIYDYWWVSQGKTTVPSIDDKEDMMFAHDAYRILGFSEDGTYNIYRLTAVVGFVFRESKNSVSIMSEHHVFLVINGWYSGLALRYPPVVIDIVGQETFFLDIGNLVGHDVIERVITSFQFSLESQTRFFKQVDDHVSTRQFTSSIEPDTDKFTETGRVV